MTYLLILLVSCLFSLLVGFYARTLLQVLQSIKSSLEDLRVSDGRVKEVPKVGFAEPKTAIDLLADQQAERIRELNQ